MSVTLYRENERLRGGGGVLQDGGLRLIVLYGSLCKRAVVNHRGYCVLDSRDSDTRGPIREGLETAKPDKPYNVKSCKPHVTCTGIIARFMYTQNRSP